MDDKNAIAEILEIVVFLKDNAATKDEVGGLRDEVGGLRDEVGGLRDEVGGLRTEVGSLGKDMVQMGQYLEKKIDTSVQQINQKIDDVKQDFMTHVDGLVVMHKKDEVERTAMLAKTSRLEEHVEEITSHLQLKLS